MERKRILCELDIDTSIFLTSFEKASKLLLEQKDKLEKEGWSNIHLKMDYYYGRGELIVMGTRLENDTEYNKRIIDVQKKFLSTKKKEERERKKYEKLKLKYES